jgi:hypothetical protein
MWQHLQRNWFLHVNELAQHTPGLHEPFRLYAQYGVLLFAGALLAGWWMARANPSPRAMAAALWAPVGALLALGLNQPLGRFVHEARPYAVFPHALVLVARTHDFSFPSDHAVMAGAVTAGLLLTHRTARDSEEMLFRAHSVGPEHARRARSKRTSRYTRSVDEGRPNNDAAVKRHTASRTTNAASAGIRPPADRCANTPARNATAATRVARDHLSQGRPIVPWPPS